MMLDFLKRLFSRISSKTLPEPNEQTVMVRGSLRRFTRDDASSPWREAKPPPADGGSGTTVPHLQTVPMSLSTAVVDAEMIANAERTAGQAIAAAKHPNLSDPSRADLRYFVWRRGSRGPTASLQAINPSSAMDKDVAMQAIVVVHNVLDEEVGLGLEEMVRRHPCPKEQL